MRPDTALCGAQAVQAGQITFEDYFMASFDVLPLKIVGWEGVLGFVFMAGAMLPVVAALPGIDGEGVHEDTIDSLHVRPRGRHACACHGSAMGANSKAGDTGGALSAGPRWGGAAGVVCTPMRLCLVCLFLRPNARSIRARRGACWLTGYPALQIISGSTPLIVIVSVYAAASLLYNLAGMSVTGASTAHCLHA